MATKSIAWDSGGGYIRLTYTGSGNGTISVESDDNTLGTARSKTITVSTTQGGVVTENITINQAACPVPVGTVLTYGYTGSVQSVTLPAGSYKLQCWGAQGGSVSGSYTATGAKGGYSEGTLTLSVPTTVYIFVGGQGSSASTSTTGGVQNGGWNGGGGAPRVSQYNSGGTNGISYPRPGGGATDISTVTSDMSYSSYRNNRSEASLLARLIVAGGGAGASARYTNTTSTITLSPSASKQGYAIAHVSDYELVTMTPNSTQSGFFHTDGTIRSNPAFTVKKYAVTPGEPYKFSAQYSEGAYGIYAVAYYDSNNNFLSYDSNYPTTQGVVDTYVDVTVIPPSGAAYLYLNTQNSMSYGSLKKYQSLGRIGEVAINNEWIYYKYAVTAGNTYNVVVPAESSARIVYGNDLQTIQDYEGRNITIVQNGIYDTTHVPPYTGQITIPSGVTYMYVSGYISQTFSVSYTTTSTSSGISNGTQVGGGTSGGGTNPGTQSGGGGELGKGANMTVTNFRYTSGGGGGGYYGGGASYDDSTTSKVNQSGGGSGFVDSNLSSAQTKDGATTFPNTAGTGNETGHSGNGYAKITRLS